MVGVGEDAVRTLGGERRGPGGTWDFWRGSGNGEPRAGLREILGARRSVGGREDDARLGRC